MPQRAEPHSLTDATSEGGAVDLEEDRGGDERHAAGGHPGHDECQVVDEQRVRPRLVADVAGDEPPNRVRDPDDLQWEVAVLLRGDS